MNYIFFILSYITIFLFSGCSETGTNGNSYLTIGTSGIESSDNLNIMITFEDLDWDGEWDFILPEDTFADITTVPNQIISADEFKLIGNYPNPFNPETTILFYLQETGVINLSVYNILGKVVYQEINTIYSSGNNSFTINLSNQMSGLYFYRFSTDKATTSGKMMLLK